MNATSSTRIFVMLGLLGALGACGGSVPVRNAPQAVHPSPSALAQGTVMAVAPTSDASAGYAGHCAAHHGHCGHGSYGNDGSRPIID